MSKPIKVKDGFTLIEVMIVISIIAILGSFLFPKFIGYEGKAKTTKAISTAKQMYTAIMCTYSEKGSSMSENDVSETILELTGANVNGMISKDSSNFNIKFISDGKEYNLVVNISNGGYKVNDGLKDIFAENWS